MKRICIVGASGKLGQYMVQHALNRGYEVVGVCRERSVGKLDGFKGRITVIPGATNDREVIKRQLKGATGCSPCWSLGALSITRRERRRRCSITRSPGRASSFLAAGTLHGTVRMCTRNPYKERRSSDAGSGG